MTEGETKSSIPWNALIVGLVVGALAMKYWTEYSMNSDFRNVLNATLYDSDISPDCRTSILSKMNDIRIERENEWREKNDL